MNIPSELPRFTNPGLILVVSSHNAKFFYAKDGVIDLSDSFETDKIKFSDKEGLFRSQTSSGSVREPQKEEEKEEFLRTLEERVKIFFKENDVKRVLLFAPDYLMKKIKTIIPNDFQDKVEYEREGNFIKESVLDLLSHYKKERTS